MRPPSIFVVCRSCGSEEVSGNGNSYWNSKKQRWETENINNFWCGDCEDECRVKNVETIQLCLFAFEVPKDWRHGGPEWYDKYLEEREV